MSRLSEFRAAEQQLKEQLALLDKLKADKALQHEIEFEEKLRGLLDEYGVQPAAVLQILDPSYGQNAPEERKTRRARTAKVYRHPDTGEEIETKGGNHKVLKQWKAQHGSDVVEGWVKA